MIDDEARAFLEEAFAAVFDPTADGKVFDQFFTRDCVQHVDGKVLNAPNSRSM